LSKSIGFSYLLLKIYLINQILTINCINNLSKTSNIYVNI